MGNLGRAAAFVRKNGFVITVEIVINGVAPLAIYSLSKDDLGDVRALIASSAPPMVWSIFEFLRHRRVDAISLLAISGIVLSLIALVGGGGVQFLQLREKLTTVLIGMVFLGSAAIGRPLIYELARATIRRRSQDEAASFEAMRDNVHFRRSMTVLTLVWGFGLVIEAGFCAFLVFHLSIAEFMIVSRIIGYGLVAGLTAWTFWYVRRQRRKGAERQAAAAPLPSAPES